MDDVTADPMFWNRAGEPIGLQEWARRKEDRGYCIVERSTVGDGAEVITAWLGTDQSFGDDVPQIFGTILHLSERGVFIGRSERFSPTEAAAREAHLELVAAAEADPSLCEPDPTDLPDDLPDDD